MTSPATSEQRGVGEGAADVDAQDHGGTLRQDAAARPARGERQAAAVSKSSSRCLCDGQYLLPGSGTRWQGAPLRVLAWQQAGLPSNVTCAQLAVDVLGRQLDVLVDQSIDPQLLGDRKEAADVGEERPAGRAK